MKRPLARNHSVSGGCTQVFDRLDRPIYAVFVGREEITLLRAHILSRLP